MTVPLQMRTDLSWAVRRLRGATMTAFPLPFHRGDRGGRLDPELVECLAASGRLADADLWLLDRQQRGEQLP